MAFSFLFLEIMLPFLFFIIFFSIVLIFLEVIFEFLAKVLKRKVFFYKKKLGMDFESIVSVDNKSNKFIVEISVY